MRQRGFTLVEMLISATLLMIVLGTAMYGYQLYMQYWQREQQQHSAQFRAYRQTDLLYNAVRSIVPYAVQNAQTSAFYFLGRDNGFTAVTQSPVFNPGALAVIRVFREETPQGQFQLVYEEASLRDMLLLDAEQELPFNHRMVLDTRFNRLEFLYQQLELKINEQFPDQTDRIKRWVPAMDGMTQRQHPVQIRLQLDGLAVDLVIPDRQNLLLQRYQRGDIQT